MTASYDTSCNRNVLSIYVTAHTWLSRCVNCVQLQLYFLSDMETGVMSLWIWWTEFCTAPGSLDICSSIFNYKLTVIFRMTGSWKRGRGVGGRNIAAHLLTFQLLSSLHFLFKWHCFHCVLTIHLLSAHTLKCCHFLHTHKHFSYVYRPQLSLAL